MISGLVDYPSVRLGYSWQHHQQRFRRTPGTVFLYINVRVRVACGHGWTLNWVTSKISLLICTWSHQCTYVIQTKNTQAETKLNQCHEIQFGMRSLHCVAFGKKREKKGKGALKWRSLCARRVMLQPGGLKSSSEVSTHSFGSSFSWGARQSLAPFEPTPSFLSIALKLTSNSVFYTTSSLPRFFSAHLLSPLGKTRWTEWSFYLCFSLILQQVQRPLKAVLAASFGGAPLCFGPAPVTTVLKCGEEGLDGAGRPRQAARQVCICLGLRARELKGVRALTSCSLLNWEGVC